MVESEIAGKSVGDVITPAQIPDSPSEPQPLRNTALALLLGLIVGAGLAFTREHFDDVLVSEQDLTAAIGTIPVIGLIPSAPGSELGRAASSPLVSITAPESPAAQSYHSLRAGLQYVARQHSIRSFLVTSALEEEGKTTTIANLAVAFARAGQHVGAISCDLRRPQLSALLGVTDSPGLTDMLLGDSSLIATYSPTEKRIGVVASGSTAANPTELLARPELAEAIDKVADYADVVLVDAPPVIRSRTRDQWRRLSMRRFWSCGSGGHEGETCAKR